jgi:NAD(P)-dependent dehydrogenase (short-subunit alcohol dehydrogenase family)
MYAKVVLITGALTGIGRATALAFAKEGASLIVSGRRDEAGAKLVTELRESGAEAEYIRADVRIEEDVHNLVDQTIKRFGRIDVAVNNAGTEGKPGGLSLIKPWKVTRRLSIPTSSVPFSGLSMNSKFMIPQGSGSIINISSTLGQRTAPGASIYVATKHAVEGLTKTRY